MMFVFLWFSLDDWEKTRNKVRTAVKDMADQLIKLYSQRLHSDGYAFSPDIDMQMDFERRFPYEETGDQLRSIDEIKTKYAYSKTVEMLLEDGTKQIQTFDVRKVPMNEVMEKLFAKYHIKDIAICEPEIDAIIRL